MVTAAADFIVASGQVAFAVAGFTVVDFAAAGFAAVDFAAAGFAEIGFIMVTSTTGFSSLTALETRSFTIPIHPMDIIPTVTIPTTIIRMAMVMVIILTVTGTVVFAAAGMAFMAAVFMAAALMPTVLTVIDHAIIVNLYNEDFYQRRGAHTKADPL